MSRSAAIRYGGALAAVAGATLARLALLPLLGEHSPFLLYALAVLVTAARFGVGPSLLATAVGGLVGNILFQSPRGALGVETIGEATTLAMFLAVGIGLSLVVGSGGRAWKALHERETQLASSRAQRRASEAELRRNLSVLDSILESSPDPIYVKDREGRFVLVNSASAAFLGTTRDGARGRRDVEFLPSDQAETLTAADREVLATEKVVVVEEVAARKGEAPRTYLSTKSPWILDGEVYGVIGISRDIHERKQREESDRVLSDLGSVLASEAEPAGLLACATALLVERLGASRCTMCRVDAERELLEVLEQAPHGVPYAPHAFPQSLVGPPWLEHARAGRVFVVEDSAEDPRTRSVRGYVQLQIRGQIAHPIVRGGAWVASFVVDDARPRAWTDAEVRVVGDAGERVWAAYENARLLRDLRELTADLERRVEARTEEIRLANRDLEAFAYSISHDLRAPLRTLQGFGNALLEDHSASLDEEGRSFACRIVAAADRLDLLIADLLAYSRMGRTQVRPEVVRLERSAREAVALLQAEIESRGASVRIEPLPTVLGHGPTLVLVLSNLIGNAVKFSRPGEPPDVVVSAERRGEVARVWVRDRGIGIAPEHQDRIFEVFERLHGQESYPGTGIGLAIVRRGIERLGGITGVESRPGEGSAFWFELPLVQVLVGERR
jgi:PAS domain S-box-containing protein